MNKKLKTLLLLGIGFLTVWLVFAPPRFVLNLTKRADLSDPVASGQALVEKYNCRSCHKIGDTGSLIGPDLEKVTRRLPTEELLIWMRDPAAAKPGTNMPDFSLSDSEIEAILAYLASLDG